jgi:hypothetical protein
MAAGWQKLFFFDLVQGHHICYQVIAHILCNASKMAPPQKRKVTLSLSDTLHVAVVTPRTQRCMDFLPPLPISRSSWIRSFVSNACCLPGCTRFQPAFLPLVDPGLRRVLLTHQLASCRQGSAICPLPVVFRLIRAGVASYTLDSKIKSILKYPLGVQTCERSSIVVLYRCYLPLLVYLPAGCDLFGAYIAAAYFLSLFPLPDNENVHPY